MSEQDTSMTDAQQRRREQNRLAQQRFRERHSQVNKRNKRQRSKSEDAQTERTSARDHSDVSQDIDTTSSRDVTAPINNEFTFELPLAYTADFCEDFNAFVHSSSGSSFDPAVLSPLSQDMLHEIDTLCNLEESPLAISSDDRSRCLDKPQTPLHMAVHKGSSKIVKLLLHHGADCNATDARSMTPLAHAVIGNHGVIVELLLTHGARLTAIDQAHRSALHLAVMYRHERLLKAILDYCGKDSALIDCPDTEGKSPLHIAIDLDSDASVELLCEAGADLQLKYGCATRNSPS